MKALDGNWPIFDAVRGLLLQHPKETIEPVPAVLSSEDAEWIHNCLEHLIAHMLKEYQREVETRD